MKKFFVPIFVPVFTAFILSFLFGSFVAPANAAEPQKIKEYYGESLGKGEKVYHIEACTMIRSYAPLRCAAENAKDFQQCKTDGKTDETKFGKIIQGCRRPGVMVDASTYEAVDVPKYDDAAEGGCKDKPEKVGYKYVPEWVVLTATDSSGAVSGDPKDWRALGSVAWEAKDPKDVPNGIIEAISSESIGAAEMYRPGFCATWDYLASGTSSSDDATEIEKKLRSKVKGAEGIALRLIGRGCNNDNTDESTSYSLDGMPPPPRVHCSALNRISDYSGAGLVAQYISVLYKWAASVVGIIAVLVITFSGIQIATAGGDSAKLDSAKNRIAQSLAGLAILFLSGLILYTINPGFFTG
ncbi:MAG: pilin [Patescibacteria group bacterium]